MATNASAWLLWQIWRWMGLSGSLARRGSGFLPRRVVVQGSVSRLVDRRRLFADAGTRRLRWLAGRIVAGEWDTATTAVTSHPAYHAFERRFLDGAPWEATGYWQDVVREVERGTRRIGCQTVEQVDLKFEGFDALWEVLGTTAYRSGGGSGPYRPWEEVLLGIDRCGDLLLIDGRHRLILAAVKRCHLPALVVVRHVDAPRARGHTSR